MSLGKKKDPPKRPGKPARPQGSREGFAAFEARNRSVYKRDDMGGAYDAHVANLQDVWDQSYQHGGAYHAPGHISSVLGQGTKSLEKAGRMPKHMAAKHVNKSHSGHPSLHSMKIKDLFNL